MVRSAAIPLDIPVSARIWPIKGATPVIAGRRLAASSTIPNTRRKLRRRERPDADVAGVFFVRQRLPDTLQWLGIAYEAWLSSVMASLSITSYTFPPAKPPR